MSNTLVLAPLTFAAVLLIALAIVFVLHRFHDRFTSKTYPPGPPGDLLLGHFRSLPSSHAYLYYTQLKKTIGDVVQLRALGTRIVILGSWDAVNQLIVKRGLIYSERPRFPVSDYLLGLHNAPPLSPLGPTWKEERRLFHTFIGRDAIKSQYSGIIEAQAQQYVLKTIEAGIAVSTGYFITMAKTNLQVVYGIKIESDDDELLRTALEGTEISSPTIIPGRHLPNVLPFLVHLPAWFPGTSWKQVGKTWRPIVHKMMKNPFQVAQELMNRSEAEASLTSNMLSTNTTLTKEQIMLASGSSFIAGIEGTGGTVLHFLRAMLLYPAVQRKAQEEIDRVIGSDRLPTLADQSQLPYAMAVYREVLRWHPIVPFPIPRVTTKDDVYRDWMIPRGTLIIQNSWAISRDEQLYSDPDIFKPERFLGENPEMDPKLYVYGAGRRICPGMPFAENVVLGAMLTIFATANVQPTGGPNQPPMEFPTTGKLADLPLPFEFRLEPRSEAAVNMLNVSVAA